MTPLHAHRSPDPSPRSGGRTSWSTLGSLALPFLLAACASAPPSNPTANLAPVPATWSAAPSASAGASVTDITGWWTGFQDAQLTALVDQALRTNTSVKSAQAALRREEAAELMRGRRAHSRMCNRRDWGLR